MTSGEAPDSCARSTLLSWSTWLEHHEPQHDHQDQHIQASQPEEPIQATQHLTVLRPALVRHEEDALALGPGVDALNRRNGHEGEREPDPHLGEGHALLNEDQPDPRA